MRPSRPTFPPLFRLLVVLCVCGIAAETFAAEPSGVAISSPTGQPPKDISKELTEAFEVGAAPLRQAIEDLMQTFPRRYSRGKEYLARLDRLRHHSHAQAFGPRGVGDHRCQQRLHPEGPIGLGYPGGMVDGCRDLRVAYASQRTGQAGTAGMIGDRGGAELAWMNRGHAPEGTGSNG